MPELVMFSGDEAVLRCPLHGQTVTVGRSPANDISIPDTDAPPLLCSFEPLPEGGYRVLARGGKPLSVAGGSTDAHTLVDGDTVSLGRLEARYLAQDSAETTARASAGGGQRTGILRTDPQGRLTRTDLALRLPDSLGGRRLDIPERGVRLGADETNDVVIDNGFVSSFHAEIFLRGERLFVRDLDSTNGTFIGSVRVIEAEVPLDAALRFGDLEIRVESSEVKEVVDDPGGAGPWRCDDLLTKDPMFAKTFQLIERVANHDATVCVFGETGTGKELVARALHRMSGRAGGRLFALNCAALPSNLIEAELFGHEKGAFTGADKARAGAFEQADGGTLFLDEIGELPLEMQGKLLRVLEERVVRRLGGHRDLGVDLRVVCATHRDLVQHVKDGRFREDLLHRLYVVPIHVPPLRSRPLDVSFLAEHLAAQLSPDGKAPRLTDAARKKLLTHPYPGNVRELRNVVQRALIFGDGESIDSADVEFLPATLDDQTALGLAYRAGMTMEEIERDAFEGALAAFDGVAAEAARALGLAKTTFWRRATALGLLRGSGH